MIALVDEKVPARRLSFESAREAQSAWAAKSIRERCRWLRPVRALAAERARELADITAKTKGRPFRETLTAEVIPLLEACRFLQRRAPRILRTEYFRQARPAWLGSTRFEIQHRPLGLILIVGPQNYPLFLPAVQALHALTAGNAVCLKPAPRSSAPLEMLREIFIACGLDRDLFLLLPEDVAAVAKAVQAGVDKVIFTGSSAHGRELLGLLAHTNTPGIMELSGADNVFVRADADLARAAEAIAFALELNGGNTCLAPHAVYAHAKISDEFRQLLRERGINLIVTPVDDDAEALALIEDDEFGLGASIFSRDEKSARAFAAKLPVGLVTINDLIVPSADPRIPFGGVRASGFGKTRGAAGLREMTHRHVVTRARGKKLRHLEPASAGDETAITALLQMLHAKKLTGRGQGLANLLRSRPRS